MKKILTGLIISIALLLAAVYLFIPGTIKMQRSIGISAGLAAVSRVLAKDDNWNKWWPVKTPFSYNGENYKLRGNTFNVIGVDMYSGTDTIKSRLELALIDNDSMTLIWAAEKATSANPFTRYSVYRDTKRIQENMSHLLEYIKTFLEKPENVYGFFIHKTMVTDSVLVSTRRSFDHHPDPKEIDAMIQSIKKYIAENSAAEKNYPMLNITKLDSADYEVMTAIPVDRSLPDTKEFTTKYMLKQGNILESEVKGGPYTIAAAIDQLEIYRADHQYTSPAIPYQLLVTDRTKETDTARWVTKLYYPVL